MHHNDQNNEQWQSPLLTLTPTERATLYKIFISRNANYTQEWGSENQKKWAECTWLAVQRCSNWLNTDVNHPKSLNDIYNFCANERFKISLLLRHRFGYGITRLIPDHYDDDDEQPRISPFLAKRLRTNGQFEDLYAKFKSISKEKDIVYLIMKDDTFIYSTIPPDNNNKNSLILTFSWDAKDEILSVQYPNSKAARKLLQRANHIWLETYQERNTLSAEQKFKRLAKILWHHAVSCTTIFGNAGISEFVFYSLSLQLSLPLLSLSAEKSWDINAIFTMNEDEYANWFYDYMITNAATDIVHEPLPALLIDRSDEIERAARSLTCHDLVDMNEDELLVFLCQKARLVDPYGFSLYHHYISNLLIDNSLSKAEKINKIQLISTFLKNGQNLLLDAIYNKSHDPILFFIETGVKDKIIFYHGHHTKDEFINKKIILSKEIEKILYLIEYQELFEDNNKTIIEKFNKLKEYIIASYSSFSYQDFSYQEENQYELIKKQLEYFQEFINNQQPFNYSCLKSLAINAYHSRYFKDINFIDLVTVRKEFNNESLLAILLKYNSFCIYLISNSLEELRESNNLDSLPLLLDCMLSLDLSLQNNILIEILKTLSIEEVKNIIVPWKEKHPEFHLISIICQGDSISNKIIDYLTILINKDEINCADSTGKIPLYYLLMDSKTSLIKFFLNCGADINLVINKSSNELIRKNFCDLIYSPYTDREFALKLCNNQVCLSLNPEELMHPYIKEEYFYESQDQNFCLLLNHIAQLLREENSISPHFFTPENSFDSFKKVIMQGLFDLIKQSCLDNKIVVFLSTIDFLTKEDRLSLKEIIEKNQLQIHFQETLQVIDQNIIINYKID